MSGIISYTAAGGKSGIIGKKPAFWVSAGSTSIPGTGTRIEFNNQRFDTCGNFGPGAPSSGHTYHYSFKTPIAGIYYFWWSIQFDVVADGNRCLVYFYEHGTSRVWQDTGAANSNYVNISGSWNGDVAAGKEFYLYSDSNATVRISVDSSFGGWLVTV